MPEPTIHELLHRYWGYEQFRPLQQDIIESVLLGGDTLALLPTGGGKSICFQVPAMAKRGLCIVVSPLVALMQDQVEQLKRRGIKAISIHAALREHEIVLLLNRCTGNSDIKFLYLSPERLKTDIFRQKLGDMAVSMVAIDEAHCISQWGYDFRPAYLEIALLREALPPSVPFIALTATATKRVRQDICTQLALRKPRLFVQSFQRANLSYAVRVSHAKTDDALSILQNVVGCAIIYARSRRRVQQISDELNRHNIRADFYHAGLPAHLRSRKQDEWLANRTRVMVCTNAFGMGIDKPDVRLVIHAEPPESLEAYYQEAGRAGRDGKKAYAVLLYNEEDLKTLRKNADQSIPPLETVRLVYQALSNFYQIATGAGEGIRFDFDIEAFCRQFNFAPLVAHQSLQVLTQSKYLAIDDVDNLSAQVLLLYNDQQIYQLYVTQPRLEPYLKALLRLYGGIIYEQPTDISEAAIAKLISKHYHRSTTVEYVSNALQYMHKHKIVSYRAARQLPQLAFVQSRADARDMIFDTELINFLRDVRQTNASNIGKYTRNEQICRSQTLSAYFDETDTRPCGVCDICIAHKKAQSAANTQVLLRDLVLAVLPPEGIGIEDLVRQMRKNPDIAQHPNFDETSLVNTVRLLADHGWVRLDADRRISRVVDKS